MDSILEWFLSDWGVVDWVIYLLFVSALVK